MDANLFLWLWMPVAFTFVIVSGHLINRQFQKPRKRKLPQNHWRT